MQVLSSVQVPFGSPPQAVKAPQELVVLLSVPPQLETKPNNNTVVPKT